MLLQMSVSYVQVDTEQLYLIQQDLEVLPEIWETLLKELSILRRIDLIHFILTGSLEREESLVSKALVGGTALKSEYWEEPYLGYVYYLTLEEVEEISLLLPNLTTEEFRNKANIEVTLGIVENPEFWQENFDRAITAVYSDYMALCEFYKNAAECGNAMIFAIV